MRAEYDTFQAVSAALCLPHLGGAFIVKSPPRGNILALMEHPLRFNTKYVTKTSPNTTYFPSDFCVQILLSVLCPRILPFLVIGTDLI